MANYFTPKPLPTQERLHQLFYCVGGVFYRKTNISQCKVGDKCGYLKPSTGYIIVSVDGVDIHFVELFLIY